MRPHLEERIVQWKAQTKGHQGRKTTRAAVDTNNYIARPNPPQKAWPQQIKRIVYKIANLETWSSPRHSQKWLQSLELGKLPAPGHLMIFHERGHISS